MPQMRVSGFLDEGTDVDPRDAERLLPLSTVHVKGPSPITQRGGSLIDTQSDGRQFSRGHQRMQQERQPAHYPAAGLSRSMPNQRQNASVSQKLPVSKELPLHHPIMVTENSGVRRNQRKETLTNVNSSFSVSNSSPTRAYDNSHQVLQHTTKRSQVDSTQRRLSNQTTPHLEQELDEDEEEDYVCCDLHSNSREPLCNEGTKNLCTLAIWAVIIFAICNRFLMHMSSFLHGSGSTKDVLKPRLAPRIMRSSF
eukprot:CCRYP_003936-RA/>CCRYP_003936-RA protein AED:0.39 eAED:0.39 QI:152/1/1/1/0/0.5/2/64/252